jgi:hypothetical protein
MTNKKLQDSIKEKDAEIAYLKSLIAKAADALQDWVGTPGISKDTFGLAHRKLIVELRKEQ